MGTIPAPGSADEMQKNMQIEDQAEVTGNEIRAPSEVISEGHLLQDQIDAGSQAHDVKTAGTEEVQVVIFQQSVVLNRFHSQGCSQNESA